MTRENTGTFDYVVVGAGSSGATLATRLAERGAKVLLLEAGAPRDRDFWVTVPLGVAKILQDPNYVWPFRTQAQTQLAGQEIYWPRGKLPGGSSAVNGMIYVRGDRAEFDHWAALGNKGWDYASLLPYFKRLERAPMGDDAERGRSGPISVSSVETLYPNPLSDAFHAACRQAGMPEAADYNGASMEGVSYLQLSVGDGRRCSTARGYLRGRPQVNLTLATEAVATRVVIEGGRATGIEYEQGGRRRLAHAGREVILSAGPIKTPQLLELSGVGDGTRLQALGIEVRQHLPGVGENLIDHLQCRITYACAQPITLNEIVGSPLKQAWMGVKYLLTRKGVMATPSATVHAQVRTPSAPERPSVKIQLHHLTGADRYAGKGFGLDAFPGFAIGFFQLRPNSRGHLHIRSTDPHEAPTIEPRYLTDSEDADAKSLIEALRLSRKVASQAALSGYVLRETRPGIEVDDEAGLLAYIKKTGQTSWHPIGTCKMGHDPMAVVDDQLRVRGIAALRVVDSSIMPTMCSSNTNAASIMVGEKAADLIAPAAR